MVKAKRALKLGVIADISALGLDFGKSFDKLPCFACFGQGQGSGSWGPHIDIEAARLATCDSFHRFH